MRNIPFNKPYLTGKELLYIDEAARNGKLSGDGVFSKRCQSFLEERYGFQKCLLTTSCTDALEMVALLLDIKEGDEVIIPSFTFVSTANAFVLRGAKIIFADSGSDGDPNIDPTLVEALITPKTKAIVVVHYAGVACEMDTIMAIAEKYGVYVIEDAAMSIDSYYKGKPLGSIGHMATFSFHETKNIQCGEGGCLVINDRKFIDRAEIIRDKGTNRASFFSGKVDKYNWVDLGSSFLPSEINAAFLWAQLESLDLIQQRRVEIWDKYAAAFKEFEEKRFFQIPKIPSYATNNAHMFYILNENKTKRDQLIAALSARNIMGIFHYLPLHQSPFYQSKHDGRDLARAVNYSETVIRLPFFFCLTNEEQELICETVVSTVTSDCIS
jgi:dTDP-4-amino-4,6-dideoxygalactose transaminase